jgi:hypothetical protein
VELTSQVANGSEARSYPKSWIACPVNELEHLSLKSIYSSTTTTFVQYSVRVEISRYYFRRIEIYVYLFFVELHRGAVLEGKGLRAAKADKSNPAAYE